MDAEQPGYISRADTSTAPSRLIEPFERPAPGTRGRFARNVGSIMMPFAREYHTGQESAACSDIMGVGRFMAYQSHTLTLEAIRSGLGQSPDDLTVRNLKDSPPARFPE